MTKDYCALCRLTFAISDPYRRKRKDDDVHDHCILRHEKGEIVQTCRKFLLEFGHPVILDRFILESDRVRGLRAFVELLSETLGQVWLRTTKKENLRALEAFAADMSDTLTVRVRWKPLLGPGLFANLWPLQ